MAVTSDMRTFTGLLLYRDPARAYSFFVPLDWHRLELDTTTGQGVMYAPEPDDPLTSLSVEARDLGVAVQSDDVAALKAGFLAGLRKLPRSVIESSEAEVIGSLVTMEAHHTFRQDQVTRKRWVRLLYKDTLQVRLVAQAATVERFDYWLPVFYETIRTFRFGDWAAEAPEGAS